MLPFSEKGYAFIASEYGNPCYQHTTTMFQDVNLPQMNGCEFLEGFTKMDGHNHQKFTINMLSSSVDFGDQMKANANKFSRTYLLKTLRIEISRKLILTN